MSCRWSQLHLIGGCKRDVAGLGPEWEKEGISESFSAETYIHNALHKLDKSCGLQELQKFNTPFEPNYHPESDESELLPEDQISVYKSLLGSANWTITSGQFDIAYATNTLSRYSMAPR